MAAPMALRVPTKRLPLILYCSCMPIIRAQAVILWNPYKGLMPDLQQRACYHYNYGPHSKTWFSQTYRPRFNWVSVKPKPSEQDNDLTLENRLYVAEASIKQYQSTSPLLHEQLPKGEWSSQSTTLRGGLLGIKIGVVPQWTITGKKILCTMLQILDNHVIDYKSPAEFSGMPSCRPEWRKKGYGMLVVGAVCASPLEFSEEYNALFEKSGLPPMRKLTRFIITENAAIAPGTPLSAQHFNVGDYVDINSRTIDMGFQGALVRWGMKGGPASHGVTKAHRRLGAIGGGGDKAGIWKGKHMPGHMGSKWTYLRGMRIVRINTKYNVIYVEGPNVPGPPHAYVRILDTLLPYKRAILNENPPPMPTFSSEATNDEVAENLYHKDLFNYESEAHVSYEGVNLENLFLHSKQYRLTGGTFDGKNRSRRSGNRSIS